MGGDDRPPAPMQVVVYECDVVLVEGKPAVEISRDKQHWSECEDNVNRNLPLMFIPSEFGLTSSEVSQKSLIRLMSVLDR